MTARRRGRCHGCTPLPAPWASATPDLVHSLMHTEDGQRRRRCMPHLHCPASADSSLRLRQRSRPPVVPRTRQQAEGPAEPRRDAPGCWRGTGHRSPGTPPWRGGLHARMGYRVRVWVRSGQINACMRCMRIIAPRALQQCVGMHPSCTCPAHRPPRPRGAIKPAPHRSSARGPSSSRTRGPCRARGTRQQQLSEYLCLAAPPIRVHVKQVRTLGLRAGPALSAGRGAQERPALTAQQRAPLRQQPCLFPALSSPSLAPAVRHRRREQRAGRAWRSRAGQRRRPGSRSRRRCP